MRYTIFQGEKDISAIALRVYGLTAKSSPKTIAAAEAALKNANPQLAKLGSVKKGTPIAVPDVPSTSPSPDTFGFTDLPDGGFALEALDEISQALADAATARANEAKAMITAAKSAQVVALTKREPALAALLQSALKAAGAQQKQTGIDPKALADLRKRIGIMVGTPTK